MTRPLKDKRGPRLRIKVPEDIIETSTQKDSSHCMIAEAVQRAVPRARYVAVDLATIRFSDPQAGVRYVYLTPRSAQEALLMFDQGEKPEPFVFQLEGAHVLLAGNARKARATLEPGQVKDSVPVRVGGKPPPVGPLASGNHANRTGRRREFGLRAIIR